MRPTRITSADVLGSLYLRWPATEYLAITEAPEDSARMGRKIDLLVISVWQSRGFERDAIEIKVTAGDLAREIANAEKADWWWRHTHRFWLAVPPGLHARAKEVLPRTWGLLVCEPGAPPTSNVVAPRNPDVLDLPRGCTIGLMRAAANAGLAALERARHAGYDAGYQKAHADIRASTADGAAQKALTRLSDIVDAFEETSGLSIAQTFDADEAALLGRLVAAVRTWRTDPEWAIGVLDAAARKLVSTATDTTSLAAELRGLFGLAATR